MDTLKSKIDQEINAPVAEVWDAIVNSEKVEKYFFGTKVESDWKVGSPIYFRGEWEGKPYEDKGTILKFEPEKVLQFNYWSSLSGKEDKPENYNTIAYELAEKDGKTVLSISQDNIADEEAKSHSEANWRMVLNNLKELVEK